MRGEIDLLSLKWDRRRISNIVAHWGRPVRVGGWSLGRNTMTLRDGSTDCGERKFQLLWCWDIGRPRKCILRQVLRI